jgi:hypothetical protein
VELWFAVPHPTLSEVMDGSKIRKRLSGTVVWVYTSSLITSLSPASWLQPNQAMAHAFGSGRRGG